MFKKNNNSKGFTLIELIVVITIIGILAGMLFVVMNPRERTKSAEDTKVRYAVDNIKLAIVDYFSRNNNSFEGLKDDQKIKNILNKLPEASLEADESNWAVKAKLNNGKDFCRDSSGKSVEKENQDISDYLCD